MVHVDRRLRHSLRRRRVARNVLSIATTPIGSSAPLSFDARGDEALGGTWAYLDTTALGRQEDWLHTRKGHPETPANVWLRRHDEYEAPWPAQRRPGGGRSSVAPPRGRPKSSGS